MQVDLTFPFVAVVLGAVFSSLVTALFLRWLVKWKSADERFQTAVAVVILAIGVFCAVFGWIYAFTSLPSFMIVGPALALAACTFIGAFIWGVLLGQSGGS
ncbi:MAG: hypothetical protein JSW61_08610 [Candidatus Thorarchaeota archaeon]|nr:MAG: hypothetical protein JSW61_08610 [Candidatus Thorarchaeota archaeon]